MTGECQPRVSSSCPTPTGMCVIDQMFEDLDHVTICQTSALVWMDAPRGSQENPGGRGASAGFREKSQDGSGLRRQFVAAVTCQFPEAFCDVHGVQLLLHLTCGTETRRRQEIGPLMNV